MGEELTSIGDCAFSGCSGLTALTIPNNVKSIGRDAFRGCSGLTALTIGNSVTSIGETAFGDCYSLTALTIPNSVTSIGIGVFGACCSLTSVTIPNSVTTIGEWAFSGCSGLTTLTIPNSVTSIGSNAFYECSGLTSVTIPNSVTTIGNSAFGECSGLTALTIGNSVTSIGEWAFSGCSGLTFLAIPNSVTAIGNYAFYGCSDLTSLTIGNGVTSIGNYVFQDCSRLTALTILNSMASINHFTFSGCNLQKVYFYAQDPPSFIPPANAFTPNQTVLYVPQGSVEAYKSHSEWGKYKIGETLRLTTKRDFFGIREVEDEMEMKGVTADGVSQLNVIYPTEDDVSYGNLRAVFSINGEECTDMAMVGTCSNIQKMPSGWGMVYTAPEDFPESITGNEYTIDVEFTTEENGLVAVLGSTQIKVYRPGVLLLHGLAGHADDCFGYLRSHLISEGGYQSFQIVNGDYSSSNTESFHTNTFDTKVVQLRLKQLYNQLYFAGIVSSKYDLVGHSMGGILSRLYAQEVNVKGVNRIITLNTPHSGSQLGTAFGWAATALTKAKAIWGLLPGNEQRNAQAIESLLSLYGSNNAVADLSPSSSAIQRLNASDKIDKLKGKVPVHTIGSYMTDVEYNLTDNPITFPECSTFILNIITFLVDNMDSWAFDKIFDEDKHDGIVPLNSQLGGLSTTHQSVFSAPYKGFWGQNSEAHHTNVHHWDEVCNKITSLLHDPKSSSSFSMDGFNPVELSTNHEGNSDVPELSIKPQQMEESSEVSFIKVEATQEEGRVLHLQISQSDDVVRNLVYAVPNDEQIILDSDTLETRFLIPDTFEGNLIVYVLGRTQDDELVGDAVVVSYESVGQMAYLLFQDRPNITMTVGQQLEPNVLGGWSNGDEWYLVPEYTTDREDILKIEGGMVTAVAEGECHLYASYKGLTDELSVKVFAGETINLRGDINGDKVVNISDVTALVNIILGKDSKSTISDVDGDGYVNISDVTTLVNIILGK